MVRKSVERLKWKPPVRKGALKLKDPRLSVRKTKMMIVCDKNRYFRKALLPVLRLLSLSDVVVCRSRGKDTLKQHDEFKCQSQGSDTEKECPSTELIVQSLDVVETFFIFMMP